MDEVTIGDKTYISSKRAAEITGYAKDYVGQLCREGHVDAKMVGRGWYVYEPSIRRHRFGDPQEEVHEVAEQTVEAPKPQASAWEAPIYKAETPSYIPEIETPKTAPTPMEDTSLTDMQSAWREWFDKKRQEELEAPAALPEIESPEVIEAREQAYEQEHTAPEAVEPYEDDLAVSIPLHHLVEEPQEEPAYEAAAEAFQAAPVPIQRIQSSAPEVVYYNAPKPVYEPVYEPEARIVREQVIRKGSRAAKRRNRSNAPVIALLVAISIISVAVAVIGSGFAGNYLTTLAGENRVTQYLVGERVLNK